ncbi:hypothetical protein BU26DRAFT_511493 [Trematosphaeria pertusa]|uniref:Uncharacterized protein n=1 Tax=Trematosphaeria pertusa TaxID=390896 RepID=A0A6A6HU05_9PLEO|nr:uncharacterized protein BU26DRAFT_511493 [Trematosphaeria pertusa]KAF2241399.1 hypothetical protein BU26DRAFT_511493 [Trematosphaeria pertusa]
MPSNKKRLYIALYPSGVVDNEERKYHWAFILGPKDEKDDNVPGIRFHVKNTPGGAWVYEEVPLPNVKNTDGRGWYYVGKKAAEGRYQNAAELAKPRPTFDLLNNEEIAS